MDETFEEAAIHTRLAVALDNEVLSWTMPTVMSMSGIAREVTITRRKALPLAGTHVGIVRRLIGPRTLCPIKRSFT
jgi:hypothetical protein